MKICGVSKVNKKSNLKSLLLESMFEVDGIQEAGGGDRGKEYEVQIFNAIANANFKGLNLQGLYEDPAGNDSSRADADFVLPVRKNKKIDGIVGPINVEAKLNRSAQLGGTSFSVAGASTKQINVIKDASGMDNKIIDSIKKIISTWFNKSGPGKSAAWENLFNFIVREEKRLGNVPPEKKFPLNCSKEAWARAQSNNLITPLNAKIEADVTVWTKFYNNKNVYYVQIGPDFTKDGNVSGGGLYCLGNIDPYGLSKIGVSVIDKNSLNAIKATYTIEIRPGAGGSKKDRRGIGIRAQGRLKFKPKTNLPPTQHTIDTTNGVLKLATDYFKTYDINNLPVESYWGSREDMISGIEQETQSTVKEHVMSSNIRNIINFLFEESETQELGSEIDMLKIDDIDVTEGTGSEIENAPEFTPTEQDSIEQELP
jgi:hypothetical protein